MDFSQWQWQETEKGSYLTCKLLSPWQHGFFSSHFHPQPPECFFFTFHTELSFHNTKHTHTHTLTLTLTHTLEIMKITGNHNWK